MLQSKTSYTKGIWAELYVMGYLLLKGYRIIKWRMRNPISEIDIIARKNKTLIAVEVKYRKTFDDGLYAISEMQKNNIRYAFEAYSRYDQMHYDSIRCDVCIVNNRGLIRHLQNAF